MTEQAKEYNDLVTQAQAKGLTQFKPVKRFSDAKAGEKRIAALKAALGTAATPPAAETKAEQAQEQPQPKEAKKAVKKAAKKNGKPKVEKAEKANGKKPTEVEEILGARSNGTKKAKLLTHFLANKNKKLPQTKLVAHVYGNTNKESVNSFSNCIGGLIKTVAKHGRFSISRERNEKEVTYALVSKG